MNEDRPSSAPGDGRQRNLLERITQFFQSEPESKEELIEVLRGAHERDLVDADVQSMMEGVMSVSDQQVRDIMIPRSQMVVVEREDSLEEFLPIIIESAHSRFPVIGENRDEVIGILLAKDLLPFVAKGGESFNIREILRPAVFIPESKRLNVLLREFRSSHNHMAIVVDEYGGVAGLVTIEDVLEQIVGEIEDEHDYEDDEHNILATGDDVYRVRGLTPIENFNAQFDTQFSDDEFDTIAGLVMNEFGHMPKRGETLSMAGYEFKVMRADNRRLYLLEVSPAQDDEDETAEEDAAAAGIEQAK